MPDHVRHDESVLAQLQLVVKRSRSLTLSWVAGETAAFKLGRCGKF